MKRNEKFVVERINDSIYLLPVGQMIAEYNKGIKINETCEFIWKQLEHDVSFEELIDKCAQYFDAKEDDMESLRTDIEALIKSLRDRGMLEGSRNIFKCNCSLCRNGAPVLSPRYESIKDEKSLNLIVGRYLIGGLPIEYYGDKEYLYESFEDFKVDTHFPEEKFKTTSIMKIQVSDITTLPLSIKNNDEYIDADDDEISVENTETELGQNCKETATVLIHHNELTVLDYSEEYVLFFHLLEGLDELHLSKDGSYAHFYCKKPSDEVRFNLFHAIRIAFLIFALKNRKVMLHSCSLLFNDRVWAFSAPSGTGKSTHCEIWKKLFDTPVVNGDLNLIGIENGIPYVYGTPWCGTSGVFENKRRILGGIILLKQASINRIEELGEENKILYVQQRLITSVWDKTMLEKTLEIVSEIVNKIYVKRLYCNMEDDAGYLIHDDIMKSC